jgi:hypothetical protein
VSWSLALPERLRDPPAEESNTKIDGATVTVKDCTKSQAVAPPVTGSVAVTVTVYVPGRANACDWGPSGPVDVAL